MNPDPLISEAESQLRVLSDALTTPRERECLLCYVYRMLEYPCANELRWATRYRDLRAPRVIGLERRLSAMGACCCDCEIFLNAFALAPEYDTDESDADQLPACRGARAGSTKGCALWVRQRRGWG